MNDLNLRVSGGIGEKVKKPAAPISMPYWNAESSGASSKFFNTFLDCNSADNQLKLLKQFLGALKECEQETIRFLVLLFWHADAKHPVKGFLKKHITDSRTLRQPFTEVLTSVITSEIEESSLVYGAYIGTVARLDACIDKFPPGASAVSSLEVAVASYLIRCLESCVKTLGITSESNCSVVKPEPLAPTEINKIYDLVHLTLRLLLYMIQKVTDENRPKLSSMFENIRSIIAELMSAKEVPMDSKSVSGIIYLTMHFFENGPDSWIKLLEEDRSNLNGTVSLSVYSAMATVVPAAELVVRVNGQPAVLGLTDKILALGDRYSSESSHMLAVARTVLAISKCATIGVPLISRLARFSWGHMDHHMDSVRHLAAQVMCHVVKASVTMQRQGDPTALDDLFTCLSTLDRTRKSYYVTLTALAEELGGQLLERRPDVIRDVIRALNTQAVQACATTFLETLLKKHMTQSNTETIYNQWIRVILETVKCESDPAVLHILEKILTRAVQGDSAVLGYILPEKRALSSYKGSDLKCILLVLGVVRKSDVAHKRVSFEDLMHTAYDADDEIRVLALSLAAETPRSTEPLTADELVFIVHFLDYNMNAQSPSFRQLVLANIKKILKRLEDSYKVFKRKEAEHATEIACYVKFAQDLWSQCFDSLVAGGNYGRRCVALQILTWLQKLQLEGWERSWTDEQADTLYSLLEDTYENNKALALDVLKTCPVELIKPVHSASYVTDALALASSTRPCDCVTASYRLLLLLSLPVGFELCEGELDVPERKHYSILLRILSELKVQAARAADIARAARDAPMYGHVQCLARVLGCLDARAIAGNDEWSALVADIIDTCQEVNSRVAGVVNAASPEGLLPDELTANQTDSSGGARLADGRAVTAQMLLLCAWRSVKETSLLLGSMVSQLTIEGEDPLWTLSATQVELIGECLAGLLARVRHRGAFEQAYVGFTRLLGRLWKCSSARLHQLPLQWFADIERGFASPGGEELGEYCATRRGAGLPFMIQALVTTELAVEPSAPRGRLLARCLRLCLSVARAPRTPEAAARAHLVLRALYRHAAPPADATQEAIMVAVKGFEADTWMERNSSTLLFSALCVRVFGVPRSRDTSNLCVRNRMTGRIFFLRYPKLYDFLLDQVKCASPDSTLRPSLFPTLLLLARLYPSALEGTVSNLKLERFLPHLVSLCGARDAHTRARAARAAAPLVPPHRYLAHIQALLVTLGNPAIKMNLCHGLLCQLSVLLDLKPELTLDEQARSELQNAVRGTFWIASTAEAKPCYVVADEWLRVLNLLLLRFPKLLDSELSSISTNLESSVFSTSIPAITSGREIFLSNAVYMLLVISSTLGQNVTTILMKCLRHNDYEVNISALNYLLLLHKNTEDNCQFLEHLSQISNKDALYELEREEKYVEALCNLIGNFYLECKQKALRVLALTNNTQKDIVKTISEKKDLNDETVMKELIDRVRNEHASLTSIYLESLLKMASKSLASLEVVRVLYECSTAGNDESTREAVARFLEEHLKEMMLLSPEQTFEWAATLTATVAILLEDDAPAVRQRAANAVVHAVQDKDKSEVIAARAARAWRRAARAGGAALLLVTAAMDFGARVDTGDELGEECRVFDQNETHNVYLEEFTWTRDCAVELKRTHKQTYNTHTIDEFIQSILNNPLYKDTIEKLCIDNVTEYLMGRTKSSDPKIDLFLNILHE